MTTEELIDSTAKPSDIISPIFDAIWDKVNEEFQGDVLSLPLPLRTFQLVVILQGEVDNGGFDSWMIYNKEYVAEVPDTLRRIGAVKLAALAEEVNKFWFERIEYLLEKEEWWEKEELANFVDTMNETFYKLDSGDDHLSIGEEHLDTLLVQYIRRHKSEFINLKVSR